MEHSYQTEGFKHRIFPFSGSSLNAILTPKFRRFNIGGLVEYLVLQLKHSPKVRSVRPHFSLLNAVNNFNKFSCGYSNVPPPQFQPANSHIVFTFALSDDDYEDYEVDPDVHIPVSNNISTWGIGDLKFLSIGMTSVTASEFGLTGMYHFDMQYLYNVIGFITKNIAAFNQFDMFSSEIVYNKPLGLYADQHLERSIRNLVETVPYKNWIFNSQLWRLAPNLFSPSMVTSDIAEYFFRYCSRSVRNVAQNDGSRTGIFGLNCQAKYGIAKYVKESLLAFMQNVKNSEYVFDEDSDYLAPLILLSMVEKRTTFITASRDDVHSVLDMFNERSVVWESLLSQPALVAERIMANDHRLADALLSVVDFE